LKRRAARAIVLAGLFALGLCAGCASPRLSDYAEQPGPYDALSPVELRVLEGARAFAEAGDLDLAQRRLATLCAALPENLVAATALQEIELEILARGGELDGLPPADADAPDPPGVPNVIARLYPRYRGRAETYGTAAAAVLAARLAPDAETAEAWIYRALDADPACVWAHYAQAFTLAGEKRFEPAVDALERALELDPGHPPSRRLEAELLARRGEVERAIEAWRAWLTRYGGDPRLHPSLEAEAHLELANLLAQQGDAEAALATLDAFDEARLDDPIDAALIRVVALDAQGRVADALAAARAAADAAPDDPRPLVQEALLLGDRRGDADGARAAWEGVLRLLDEAAETAAPTPGVGSSRDPAAGELAALFLRLQANAALARLDRADAERAASAADGARE